MCHTPKKYKKYLGDILDSIQKYHQKYRPDFFFVLFGSMAHVLYPIFEALFDFWNIFSKFSFFDPLNHPFWKNSKFWLFLKIFFGGMWHMFSIQFFKPFSILKIFFQNFHFLTPITPLFWKISKFGLFLKSLVCPSLYFLSVSPFLCTSPFT